MLLADPPCVGSGAASDDPDVGLRGGEIGTAFALAISVEPWADDALSSGCSVGMALGADTDSSIAGGGTGGKSWDVKVVVVGMMRVVILLQSRCGTTAVAAAGGGVTIRCYCSGSVVVGTSVVAAGGGTTIGRREGGAFGGGLSL
jgi:hypothetical protein